MRCELISWPQMYDLARRLALAVRAAGPFPDLIVAVARGGYVPARILADFLDVMDLTDLKVEHYRGAHRMGAARVRYPLRAGVDGRRVLVVDDVTDTGDTFDVALSHIRSLGTPAALHTAVLHHKTVARLEPDFHAAVVNRWRWIIYPWAAMEDLTGFAREMQPPPSSVQALDEHLKREYGLHVPRPLLEDVLLLLSQTDSR
ncbi:MAG TPA: phosphoribosyltransferase [Gammaproteobacteria bacterium]|nr:phosphoribosyltransferase [Gammaproteobacteria bacterium]